MLPHVRLQAATAVDSLANRLCNLKKRHKAREIRIVVTELCGWSGVDLA